MSEETPDTDSVVDFPEHHEQEPVVIGIDQNAVKLWANFHLIQKWAKQVEHKLDVQRRWNLAFFVLGVGSFLVALSALFIER